MKQGEIWLVRYDPSVGHEFQKTRPAIIISSNLSLKYSNLITVMAIASGFGSGFVNNIRITKNNLNKLTVDSTIHVCHISSFDERRFIKKIGRVDNSILSEIKIYLKKHFDL